MCTETALSDIADDGRVPSRFMFGIVEVLIVKAANRIGSLSGTRFRMSLMNLPFDIFQFF